MKSSSNTLWHRKGFVAIVRRSISGSLKLFTEVNEQYDLS
jgi:hypothetical protein